MSRGLGDVYKRQFVEAEPEGAAKEAAEYAAESQD